MKSRTSLLGFNQVLARFQVCTVFVGKDLITLLVTKFTHAPRPLGFPAGSLLKLLAFNDAPDVHKQVFDDQFFLRCATRPRRLKPLKPSWHSPQIVQATKGSPTRGLRLRTTGFDGRVCQWSPATAPHLLQKDVRRMVRVGISNASQQKTLTARCSFKAHRHRHGSVTN